jgi:hypothetical protein
MLSSYSDLLPDRQLVCRNINGMEGALKKVVHASAISVRTPSNEAKKGTP